MKHLNSISFSNSDKVMPLDGDFHNFPLDLVPLIYSYLDIPTLGKLAQVHRGWVSEMASQDNLWANWVELRYSILTKSASSIRAYGRMSWKEAYRTMAQCNRIPKCRYTTTRRPTFATVRMKKTLPHLASWVFLSHTPNCHTRYFYSDSYNPNLDVDTMDGAHGNDGYNNDEQNRFIELHVCLQNVKSSLGSIDVDVLKTKLQLLGRPSPVLLRNPPKILYTSRNHLAQSLTDNGVLSLIPFQYCILSMQFPCGSDILETDVLARAIAIHIPLLRGDVVQADFIPESEVWNHYMELPGGFLSLIDKSKLVT
jgi:hypothetical protein